MAILRKCPSCGFESAEIRCPRCNALKLMGCSGACSSCGSGCTTGCESAPASASGSTSPSDGAADDAEHAGTPLKP